MAARTSAKTRVCARQGRSTTTGDGVRPLQVMGCAAAAGAGHCTRVWTPRKGAGARAERGPDQLRLRVSHGRSWNTARRSTFSRHAGQVSFLPTIVQPRMHCARARARVTAPAASPPAALQSRWRRLSGAQRPGRRGASMRACSWTGHRVHSPTVYQTQVCTRTAHARVGASGTLRCRVAPCYDGRHR